MVSGAIKLQLASYIRFNLTDNMTSASNMTEDITKRDEDENYAPLAYLHIIYIYTTFNL